MVCGIVFAVAWILLIASCRFAVVLSMLVTRFLKSMAQTMVLGIHPFVVGVVACCLPVVVCVFLVVHIYDHWAVVGFEVFIVANRF